MNHTNEPTPNTIDPAPERPTLGVVTISYNEQQDLPGFLANLQNWVDEIVIIDDGSSDRTEEIAAEAGAKVRLIRSPRKEGEYFADQRNKGIDAATSDWLLHMDVDERVSAELAQEMLSAIRNPDFDGYRYRRLNYFMHRPMRGGGWQSWNLVHLAHRDKFRFAGMFHEECLIDAPEKRVGQLSGKMLHLNEDDFQKRLNKSARYSEEVVKAIEDSGRNVGFFDLLVRPPAEFLRKYVAKGGWRDGTPGLIFAMHCLTATFRANAIVWDRQNRISREQVEGEMTADWQATGGDKINPAAGPVTGKGS